MRTDRRARVAVVGLGRIGRLHADNLARRVGSAELAAVVDEDETPARDLAEHHGVRWSRSLADVLGDPAIDGVVIATPSGTHPGLVRRVAGAGRHVFCEKPLGLDVEACAEAVEAAGDAGVSLQVGFQRRFDPDWRALKKAGETGALGRIDLFRCSHRNAALPEGAAGLGDVFTDLAVHDLDAARWLCGEIEDLHAKVRAGEPGAAAISIRFGSGALGLIDVHRHAGYGFECSAELVGTAGTARCGYRRRGSEIEWLADGRTSAPLVRDHAEAHATAYVRELEHFGEVASGRAMPEVTGADALAALQLSRAAAR